MPNSQRSTHQNELPFFPLQFIAAVLSLVLSIMTLTSSRDDNYDNSMTLTSSRDDNYDNSMHKRNLSVAVIVFWVVSGLFVVYQ